MGSLISLEDLGWNIILGFSIGILERFSATALSLLSSGFGGSFVVIFEVFVLKSALKMPLGGELFLNKFAAAAVKGLLVAASNSFVLSSFSFSCSSSSVSLSENIALNNSFFSVTGLSKLSTTIFSKSVLGLKAKLFFSF